MLILLCWQIPSCAPGCAHTLQPSQDHCRQMVLGFRLYLHMCTKLKPEPEYLRIALLQISWQRI